MGPNVVNIRHDTREWQSHNDLLMAYKRRPMSFQTGAWMTDLLKHLCITCLHMVTKRLQSEITITEFSRIQIMKVRVNAVFPTVKHVAKTRLTQLVQGPPKSHFSKSKTKLRTKKKSHKNISRRPPNPSKFMMEVCERKRWLTNDWLAARTTNLTKSCINKTFSRNGDHEKKGPRSWNAFSLLFFSDDIINRSNPVMRIFPRVQTTRSRYTYITQTYQVPGTQAQFIWTRWLFVDLRLNIHST